MPEVPEGKAPFYEAPVFNEHAGYVSVLYSRLHISSAQRFVDPRQTEELPFQLRAAEAWDRLEALLLDLDRFMRQRLRGDAEMLSYWLPLIERGRSPGALVAAFENKV